ncbi:O-methyltransferase [Nakamurella antarctica]|uniref:O-methyltransferase n=2 Tax=Nakamurella antarctica TaxID=1902245 RepID=A0A3G8ZRV6_9ACTN|nr:O-methyltransferase [Nakamurella antarctica]
MLAARTRAADLGCVPTGSGAGAALRFLAAAIGAKSVVEVGTGAGVSALHLFAGMVPDGIVTSIDVESENLRAAKAAFADAGIAPARARLINGRGLEVLPRLTDGAYDLVHIDGARSEYPHYLVEALRLLRPGGIVVIDDALGNDRVSDPTQRDAETVAIRETGRLMREDENLVPVLIPLSGGVLAAVKLR